MKTVTVTAYEAFDGQSFKTAEECKAHEVKHLNERFVSLTIEQVVAARARTDTDLADAFERMGNLIGETRRESGELRCRPKTVAPAEQQQAPAPEMVGESADA